MNTTTYLKGDDHGYPKRLESFKKTLSTSYHSLCLSSHKILIKILTHQFQIYTKAKKKNTYTNLSDNSQHIHIKWRSERYSFHPLFILKSMCYAWNMKQHIHPPRNFYFLDFISMYNKKLIVQLFIRMQILSA